MSRQQDIVPLPVWQDFTARHGVGDVLDAEVTKVLPFGALMRVGDGIPGLLHPAQPRPGSSVLVRIDAIDVERRRLSLVPA
jgi:small subunit ribosomal protein S1